LRSFQLTGIPAQVKGDDAIEIGEIDSQMRGYLISASSEIDLLGMRLQRLLISDFVIAKNADTCF
jgi:hypothetical protein